MNNRRIVGVSFGAILFYAMELAVLGPLLPSISQTFRLNLSQTGIIFTVSFSGFVAFTLISGFLADKYGKRRMLAVVLLGAAVSLFFMGISATFIEALICVFFIGGCCGCLESLASAILADTNPSKESFYVNASQIFFGVGSVIAPMLAGFALSSGLLWKWCYIALSVLFLICFAALLTVKTGEDRLSESIRLEHVKMIISNRKIQILCVCMFCYSGSETCSWGWLTTFLQGEAGFSTILSSAAVSILWVFIVLGRVGCLGALQKFDEMKIVPPLALVTVIGILVSAVFKAPALIWIGIGVTGIGYSAQWPLILGYGLKDWPGYSGTAASIMIGSSALGMTVIPLLAGYLGDAFGMRAAMALPAVFLAVIAILAFYLLRTNVAKTAAEPH